MVDLDQFVQVQFHHFKAFRSFSLNLKHFNILVGPNNAGKSTILTAFRILAAAMRKANSRSAEVVNGPLGMTYGHSIDLRGTSVAEENIFYNYDDTEPAYVKFTLSNKNTLTLFFPEQGASYLIPDTISKAARSPTNFKAQFNCPIGFVPILGPVEHIEPMYEKEAARLALFNYGASRNFRNIWYHYGEKFAQFRQTLLDTWPGMDIEPPKVDYSYKKPSLFMFCPEERRPREIFWSGFGFQVWCQMLTHLIQSSDKSIFLIDEPDIYIHSDLQRQLLSLLRNLGPDIVIATHSTEIIIDAEPDDIVIINKGRSSAKRVKEPDQLQDVFRSLGSNINPILTQLAKTRRAVFVEGKDFQILGRFASKLGYPKIGGRSDFAVVPVEGFNPERIRNLKAGMEATLGRKIASAAIFDKDYRSEEECRHIELECGQFNDFAIVHPRKEIENFLLVPTAIDRAAQRRLADHGKRTGQLKSYTCNAAEILDDFAQERRAYVNAQLLTEMRRFIRSENAGLSDATIAERGLKEFDGLWQSPESRLMVIPGKDAMTFVNRTLQDTYGVNVTPTAVIEAMHLDDEVPAEMKQLMERLSEFVGRKVE